MKLIIGYSCPNFDFSTRQINANVIVSQEQAEWQKSELIRYLAKYSGLYGGIWSELLLIARAVDVKPLVVEEIGEEVIRYV
jgi:hypothetical protein